MQDNQEKARRSGSVEPRAQAQMGFLLRQVYGTVITEPVPDRFSALLDRLAESADQPTAQPHRKVETGEAKS